MANSDISWIDSVFFWCVRFLYDTADILGVTYEEINVWLFVIILPALLLFSLILNVWLLKQRKITSKNIAVEKVTR